MGSFRSQPDLTKHSINLNGAGNISYAATHMCGTSALTQVGAFTCKTRTSTSPLYPAPKTPSSGSSTATAVLCD